MRTPAEIAASERRATVRHPWGELATDCQAEAPEKEERWPARIHDASAGGLGLLIGRPFPPGTLLEIEVEVIGRASLMPLRMRVVRVTQVGDQWLHGCALDDPLSDRDLSALL